MMSAMPRRAFLPILIVMALVIRLNRLTESLWYDEIAALLDYVIRGPQAIVTTWFDPANHVLQSLLSWLTLTVFDGLVDAAILIRLPSLLFSLATVPIMMRLGRRVGGVRIGTAAAAAAAAAPVVVLSGVEARGYAAMIFFSAAMTDQLLAALDSRTARPIAVYALVAALGVWTHLATAFLAIGHAVVLLWWLGDSERRPGARRGLIGIAGGGLLSLALYAPILGQIAARRGTFSAADGDEPGLFGTETVHALLQLGGSWYLWAAAPGLVLVIIGAVRAWRTPALRGAMLLTLAGGPVMGAILLAAGSWWYARFLLFLVPGGLLLFAFGCDALLARHRAAGITAMVLTLGAWATDLAQRPPKQPLREAVQYVDDFRAGDESVLVVGIRGRVTGYYSIGLSWHPPTYALNLGAELSAGLDAADPTWIIMLYPTRVAEEQHTQLAERGFEVAQRFAGWVDWTAGDVVVLRRDAGASRSE